MYDMAIAAGFPRKLANVLVDKYPTAEGLVYFLNSSTDAWDRLQEQIYGIGDKRVRALHETLTQAGYRLKYQP